MNTSKKYELSEEIVQGLLKLIQSRPYGEVRNLAIAMEQELAEQIQADEGVKDGVVSEPSIAKEPSKK